MYICQKHHSLHFRYSDTHKHIIQHPVILIENVLLFCPVSEPATCWARSSYTECFAAGNSASNVFLFKDCPITDSYGRTWTLLVAAWSYPAPINKTRSLKLNQNSSRSFNGLIREKEKPWAPHRLCWFALFPALAIYLGFSIVGLQGMHSLYAVSRYWAIILAHSHARVCANKWYHSRCSCKGSIILGPVPNLTL